MSTRLTLGVSDSLDDIIIPSLVPKVGPVERKVRKEYLSQTQIILSDVPRPPYTRRCLEPNPERFTDPVSPRQVRLPPNPVFPGHFFRRT